ncbi:cation:proton antiporter [Reyranella sp.]|uniref:cation:proton antiporter domain-containing protein n=1 Tax=Reyranella sp. TaxID=1929291 RepID=UPI003BA87DE3
MLLFFVTLAVLFFAYGLVSGRLETTVVTGPLAFTLAGIAIGTIVPLRPGFAVDLHLLLHLAEASLVLLLFTDAARTDLSLLWNIRELPGRILGVALPLNMLVGAIAAWLILPGLGWWEAAILAAILAPTDGGVAQAVVTDPRVPLRVRQALKVEGGLADGLSVPLLLFFIAITAAAGDGANPRLAKLVLEQLGYGVVVGVAIGLGGGWLLGWAASRDWVAPSFAQIALAALPVLCLLVSVAVGASMFIAAFVAGLAVQLGTKRARKPNLDFGEIWGQVLNLSVFTLFGIVVARSWQGIDLAVAAYAITSLTVVRMLPVAISLIGSGLSRPTVWFMGWFGPRGLASIVLGLVYLKREIGLPGESTIQLATTATVALSIFAHGLSARPAIALYSAGEAAKADR